MPDLHIAMSLDSDPKDSVLALFKAPTAESLLLLRFLWRHSSETKTKAPFFIFSVKYLMLFPALCRGVR